MKTIAIVAVFVVGVTVGALAESVAVEKFARDSATARDKWQKSATTAQAQLKDHLNIADSWRKELETQAAAAKQPTEQQKVQAKQFLAQAAQDDSYASYDQSLADEMSALATDLAAVAKSAFDSAKRLADMKAAAAKGPATDKEAATIADQLGPEWKGQAQHAQSQAESMKKMAADFQGAANMFKQKGDKARAAAKKLDPSAK